MTVLSLWVPENQKVFCRAFLMQNYLVEFTDYGFITVNLFWTQVDFYGSEAYDLASRHWRFAQKNRPSAGP